MAKKIDSILVYLDYSDASLNAVESAIGMCKRHRATLHLVQVLDKQYIFPTAGVQAPVLSISHEMVQSYIDNMNNYASSIQRNHSINCVGHYEIAGIVPSVCGKARELNCDILVVGTDTQEFKRCFIVDSLPYKILKCAPCPVLTIPRETKVNAFKKILFPVRPVISALEKFQVAKMLINKNKASVHLLGALRTEDAGQFNAVRRLLATVEQKLDREKIPNSYELHFGRDIAGNILKTGRKISTDLIVITASTKRNFKQLFYGNYAQRLINNIDTAVLCVKPSEYYLR